MQSDDTNKWSSMVNPVKTGAQEKLISLERLKRSCLGCKCPHIKDTEVYLSAGTCGVTAVLILFSVHKSQHDLCIRSVVFVNVMVQLSQ